MAEIIVFDNNSTDGTDKIAHAAGATVFYERKQGKGNVVRTMFREIDADCYILVDGDDTYPAEAAREMVKMVLGGADMVIGDRLSTTYFAENKRRFHGVGNRFVKRCINKMFGGNVNDIMTGYRGFSKLFVKSFPVCTKGFEIETEMTIHALEKNLNIEEVKVAYRDRPEGSSSKLSTLCDGVKVIRTIFNLLCNYKPLGFFSTIASVLFVCAFGFFMKVFMEYLHSGLVLRFPTLIVSVIGMLVGILFYMCGLILHIITEKHRQLYELQMNIIRGIYMQEEYNE
jgi:glycosyltransferase involved in cell wall biosynthesis